MNTMNSQLLFPDGFRWGTATSSYQVEGNLTNNDWWAAEELGGFIFENQRAGAACDWWNRAEEDFDRMAAMHQNAHRLSIEWSRIEPREGVWDEDSLARYRDMLVALRERGIEPMVTLHHFTNPLWVSEQGGWQNENIVLWFERYVRKVISALGDLTTLWCTINEPGVMIAQTYALGRWAPGTKDLNAALKAGINVMRGHAAAYHAIHELQPGANVGLAHHMIDWQPWRWWALSDHVATNVIRHLFQEMILTTAVWGTMRIPGRRSILMPEVRNTLDWLGVNYYQRYRIHASLLAKRGTPRVGPRWLEGAQKGPGEWGEIHPQGMFDMLRSLWNQYRIPLYITENGIPDETDENRPGFLISHLHQLWEAIRQGIPVKGYYFWSLIDNFEWTEGYDPRFRFGLIGVDFATQERHIRPSGHLYTEICKQGGLLLDTVERYGPQLAQQVFDLV